ncbi:MAG: flagellar basal body-associated protein FliL [Acidobacteriota bacterium]
MASPEEAPVPESAPSKKSLSLVAMIGIGAGVFVLQTVLVYLLIVFVLVPKLNGGDTQEAAGAKDSHAETAEAGQAADAGKYVFLVKDLIINPAGTGGTRFLMTTVGVETGNEEELKSIEKKDVVVRDVLNTVLASKTVEALDDQTRREDLRREIRDSLQKFIRPEKVSQVYFSKFIIQ